MAAITPRGLRPGETIAFVSPSARLNELLPAVLARAKAALEARGHPVKVFWTHEDEGTGIPAHIKNRLKELLAAFADPEVRAVICTVGGTTANELVPSLLGGDPAAAEVVRANPKVFVGYSDITALHWALRAKAGLRTFYGPGVFPELGDAPGPMAFTIDNLLRAIRHDPAAAAAAGGADVPAPLGPVPRSTHYAPQLPDFCFGDAASTAASPLAATPPWRWVRRGSCTGRIFGGCLSLVVRMQGVRAMEPDWRGKVLLLETATDETMRGPLPLPRVRQFLADLVAYGVVAQAAGMVLGRFFGYDSEEARAELEGVVDGVLRAELGPGLEEGGREFPVLMNVDVGHTSPMVTIPLDALVRLDSETDTFEILEAGIV